MRISGSQYELLHERRSSILDQVTTLQLTRARYKQLRAPLMGRRLRFLSIAASEKRRIMYISSKPLRDLANLESLQLSGCYLLDEDVVAELPELGAIIIRRYIHVGWLRYYLGRRLRYLSIVRTAEPIACLIISYARSVRDIILGGTQPYRILPQALLNTTTTLADDLELLFLDDWLLEQDHHDIHLWHFMAHKLPNFQRLIVFFSWKNSCKRNSDLDHVRHQLRITKDASLPKLQILEFVNPDISISWVKSFLNNIMRCPSAYFITALREINCNGVRYAVEYAQGISPNDCEIKLQPTVII